MNSAHPHRGDPTIASVRAVDVRSVTANA